jgi:hypothetical protein
MSVAVMPPLHIPFQNNWLRGCWCPSGFLDRQDSKVTRAVDFDIPEMVNIFKLADYLSTSSYNVMLEVRERASRSHCTCRDDIRVKARDIANILN